jgi:hypothetical protein
MIIKYVWKVLTLLASNGLALTKFAFRHVQRATPVRAMQATNIDCNLLTTLYDTVFPRYQGALA